MGLSWRRQTVNCDWELGSDELQSATTAHDQKWLPFKKSMNTEHKKSPQCVDLSIKAPPNVHTSNQIAERLRDIYKLKGFIKI